MTVNEVNTKIGELQWWCRHTHNRCGSHQGITYLSIKSSFEASTTAFCISNAKQIPQLKICASTEQQSDSCNKWINNLQCKNVSEIALMELVYKNLCAKKLQTSVKQYKSIVVGAFQWCQHTMVILYIQSLVGYKFHTKTQFNISHSVQEKRKMPVAPFPITHTLILFYNS